MDGTREINWAIYTIAKFFIGMGIVALVIRFLTWGWVRRYAAWIAISLYSIVLIAVAVGTIGDLLFDAPT